MNSPRLVYSLATRQSGRLRHRSTPALDLMKSVVAAAGLLLSSALAPAVSAPQVHLRVSGIYSDLYYNSEGGDLLGMELLVIPCDPSGYRAFIQIAEGGPPYAAIVPLLVDGSRVEFTLPAGSAYSEVHFVGTLSSTKLVLHSPQGKEEVLKRGKSYWQ